MKKILRRATAFVLLVAFFLLGKQFVSAQSPEPLVLGETMEMEDVKKGPHFFAQERVVIDETLEGDVYVAGGEVIVDGTIIGDLLVAGGEVTIAGQITDDVRAAGGTVTISAEIGKNVSVAGGDVYFDSDSVVAGSVLAAAGDTSFDGQVAGKVKSWGEVIELAGLFGSEVEVSGQEIVVSGDAELADNLIARYERNAIIDDEAEIVGEKSVEKHIADYSKAQQFLQGNWKKIVAGAIVAKVIFSALTALIGGAVLLALFPKQVESMLKSIKSKYATEMVWGFVYLVGLPILMMFIFMTIFGIPLSFVTLLFYVLTLIVASWMGNLILGQQLYLWSKFDFLKPRLAQLLVGVFVAELLGLIPILGWLLRFLLFLLGLGTVIFILSKSVGKK